MAADELILRQNEGDALALEHAGRVEHKAELVHATTPERPLVHMVMWDEKANVDVKGRLVLAGDDKAPLEVRMHHAFDNDHRQTHRIETALERPVHHALQMRTPLQVRFCNPWHVASDYTMEIRMGDNRVISVRLTGATVATPQPCPDDKPCAPVNAQPDHP